MRYTRFRLPPSVLCLLISAFQPFSLSAFSTAALPRDGLKLHLAAANAVVSQDNKVAALSDQGPRKLRVNASGGDKSFGGLLNKSALNGQNTISIQNNGFRLDEKNASAANASRKGFALVLVAKITGLPPSGYFSLVKKQSGGIADSTGYRVHFDANAGQISVHAGEDKDNRRSRGISPLPENWFVLVMSADTLESSLDASINGRPAGKGATRGGFSTLSNRAPLEIGSGSVTTVMEFAELAIYDRPLSTDE